MLVDATCHSCGFDFDGHWSLTGTCITSDLTCPKCLVKGRCSTTTDENFYSDSGDDDVDTE